jgi:hypothetical protein
MVQHLMTFNKGEVQIQEHECHSLPGVIYNETLIHDPKARIIGTISASEPYTQESLGQHITQEYH